MAFAVPQARRPRVALALAASLVALSAGGCLRRGPEITGSIGTGPQTADGWRREAEALAPKNGANPGDAPTALRYAAALRALDQKTQAVAVLEQAAVRQPKNLELLSAYGKALGEAGRYKEASEVLARAHLPERPDWRVLSAQGAVADQTGDHGAAQRLYETALKIRPGEPSVLSNLGLSYALARRLPEAEESLRSAAAQPGADARVRQNLALVLGLQGKFDEAQTVLRRDLSAEEASANLSALRGMVSQPNSWAAIRKTGAKGARVAEARTSAE